MPNPVVEHTYLIEASDASLRWRLTIGPRTTIQRLPERACAESYSLQVIVELVAPSDSAEQLDVVF